MLDLSDTYYKVNVQWFRCLQVQRGYCATQAAVAGSFPGISCVRATASLY